MTDPRQANAATNRRCVDTAIAQRAQDNAEGTKRASISRGSMHCFFGLSTLLVAVAFVGCSRSEDVARDTDIPVAMPGAANVGTPEASLSAPILSQINSQTKPETVRLEFSKEYRNRIRWGHEPLRAQIASTRWDAQQQSQLSEAPFQSNAIRLVQNGELPPLPEGADEEDLAQDAAAENIVADEDAAVGPSASDLGPVEVIPTPMARPEVKAEIIPTPQGIPENKAGSTQPMARIAADPANQNTLPVATTTPAAALLTPPGTPKTETVDPNMANDLKIAGLTALQSGPEDHGTWQNPGPEVVLMFTGDQHGYIEPCGCTGLDKQKGGIARRFTFMEQLKNRRSWNLVPIDAGNQVRRIGLQSAIKLNWSNEALKAMKYQAVGLGPDDIRLGADNLLPYVYPEDPATAMYQCGNVLLFGDESFLATHKVIEQGAWKIGVTNLMDPKAAKIGKGGDITIKELEPAAKALIEKLKAAGTNFNVVTYFGDEKTARELVRKVPGFDLIVYAGSYGEPTNRPKDIEGSKTKMIYTGYKGMYVGLVGLFKDKPYRYARVALTHEFDDAPDMRDIMRQYQEQLKGVGLKDLGLTPIPHPSGEKYVGTEACGKCHTEAMKVWEGSHHAHATDSIVKPPVARGDIARHFDPECISCHVTGWNPQRYYPYETGYLELEKSKHLTGNGCENCHGPGASHAKAEAEDSGVSEEKKKELRLSMQLPLEKAKEHCMKCHDLDNSPDFHEEDAFEDTYWPDIEHYGVD